MSAKTRGVFATLALAAGVAGSALLAQPAAAQQKTLQFVPEADLRSLDPIWTTAYITRNHGYMVYDTLFAIDEKFEVAAADGGQMDAQRRQADLHLHAARRAQVA